MESLYEVAVEEIASAKNQVEKEMLLQKYGIIEPRLTPQEQADIAFEVGGYNVNGGYAFTAVWQNDERFKEEF